MCARDEQTATERQVLMFYPLGKKLRKILWGGGGIPIPFYVPGLNDPRKKPALIIVGKTDCQKEN